MDFLDHFGSALLAKYASSPSLVVISVFDDFAFQPWFFKKVPRNLFSKVENRIAYVQVLPFPYYDCLFLLAFLIVAREESGCGERG